MLRDKGGLITQTKRILSLLDLPAWFVAYARRITAERFLGATKGCCDVRNKSPDS
jgi:hypothetical protein